MLVYKIDVLKTLNESGYTPGKLRKEKLLGENAIQCLRENKMQPGNIIKYVDTTEK